MTGSRFVTKYTEPVTLFLEAARLELDKYEDAKNRGNEDESNKHIENALRLLGAGLPRRVTHVIRESEVE